jgi:hypothetical protein
MNYHFQRKYKDRKDISILVVEKNLDPFETEDTRHDISGIASFLEGYGFNVDIVWSIAEHRFNDFSGYYGPIIQHFNEKIEKDLQRKDNFSEIFARSDKRRLDQFKDIARLLKRESINSVEDLSSYDFLIMHPGFKDREKILPEILKKYPDKPLIFPIGSIGASDHNIYARDFIIEDIKKDPRYESVYVVDTDSDSHIAVLTLIEYILDNREKVLL